MASEHLAGSLPRSCSSASRPVACDPGVGPLAGPSLHALERASPVFLTQRVDNNREQLRKHDKARGHLVLALFHTCVFHIDAPSCEVRVEAGASKHTATVACRDWSSRSLRLRADAVVKLGALTARYRRTRGASSHDLQSTVRDSMGVRHLLAVYDIACVPLPILSVGPRCAHTRLQCLNKK